MKADFNYMNEGAVIYVKHYQSASCVMKIFETTHAFVFGRGEISLLS